MADLILNIDIRAALAALKKLNKSVDDTGKKADDSFGRARDELGGFIATGEKGGKKLGASIGGLVTPLGAVTAGVAALSAAFVALAAAGVSAFADITAEGVQLASQLENARITFTNILGGNAEAAEVFLGRLNQQALKLGVNFNELSGFAKSLLPDTESVDQFDRLVKAAVTLDKSDPDKSFDDVRIAIEGALSGDFVSLQERFDIPRARIEEIKELQKELGNVEGVVQGLSRFLADTGSDLESFTDTFTATQDRIEARLNVFKTVLGEPVLEGLKEEFSLFDELLAENSDDIQLFVAQIGDIVAAVTDFIGTGLNEFLATLDFSQLEQLGIAIQQAFAAAELIVDVLFQVPEASSGIDRLTASILELRNGLIVVAEFAGKLKLALEGTLILAKAVFQIKTGDVVAGFESLKDLGGLFDPENIKKSANETDAAFDRFAKRLEDISETTKERRKELEEGIGDPVLIDAELEKKNAEKAADEAARAQEEIDKKRSKLTDELADSRIKAERKQRNSYI
jgi:hypothetical protein